MSTSRRFRSSSTFSGAAGPLTMCPHPSACLGVLPELHGPEAAAAQQADALQLAPSDPLSILGQGP